MVIHVQIIQVMSPHALPQVV